MKKLTFLFAFAIAMILTACNGCKNAAPEQQEPAKAEAIVVNTNDFSELVAIANLEILKNYPQGVFYEASALLAGNENGVVDGTVDRNTFRSVYGDPYVGMCTYMAVVENDTLKLAKIDEPWLEDIVTCAFVPLTVPEAIEIIQSKVDIAFTPKTPVVLRHQLYPGEAEERFFFGSAYDCHTVNVHSLKVDQPAGGKLGNGVVAPKEEKAE